MIQDNRHDAILVRIVTYEGNDEKYIASYYTTALNETLKMFITAKDYGIDCYFNEYSEEVPKEYASFPGYTIQDVRLLLGTREDLAAIEVVI